MWPPAFISTFNGRQNIIMKVRFIGNQSKHRWYHYSTAITFCKQHLLHSYVLKKKNYVTGGKEKKKTPQKTANLRQARTQAPIQTVHHS